MTCLPTYWWPTYLTTSRSHQSDHPIWDQCWRHRSPDSHPNLVPRVSLLWGSQSRWNDCRNITTKGGREERPWKRGWSSGSIYLHMHQVFPDCPIQPIEEIALLQFLQSAIRKQNNFENNMAWLSIESIPLSFYQYDVDNYPEPPWSRLRILGVTGWNEILEHRSVIDCPN